MTRHVKRKVDGESLVFPEQEIFEPDTTKFA